MPLLNYTTSIKADKTISEITHKLSQFGAKTVTISYDDDNRPSSLSFSINVRDRMVSFQLPSRWEKVYLVMQDDKSIARQYKNSDQAIRTSWRIIRTWVFAQLAIIEAELAELAEVFLPYAISQDGDTLWEKISSGDGLTLLTSGVQTT